MKKTGSAGKAANETPEMLPEYRFDYRMARPNRFAADYKPGARAILLDADAADVFATSESVNEVLRALIRTMPHGGGR